MDNAHMDELAGRIDGVARAVLHLAAALERAEVIDGPRLSAVWRGSVPDGSPAPLLAAHHVLLDMARRLDDARATARR